MSDQDERQLVGAERVLNVLVTLASEPNGLSLDELARRTGAAKPTAHRALRSLIRLGLATQRGRGSYVIGDEFLRLAYLHQGRRSIGARLEPLLDALTAEFGETSHFAVLDGEDVVYQAKSDPVEGAIRLSSVIGGRNPAYRTAVGKTLLSYIETPPALPDWATAHPFEIKTPNTITSADALLADIRATRERGYGIDDQENEVGINCVALPVFLDSPDVPSGAISVSGLAFRTPLATLVEAVPRIHELADGFNIRTR